MNPSALANSGYWFDKEVFVMPITWNGQSPGEKSTKSILKVAKQVKTVLQQEQLLFMRVEMEGKGGQWTEQSTATAFYSAAC